MFVFLSKLLPVFVYPLGLACVLLVISLVLAWWQPRLAAIPTALALLVLVIASMPTVNTALLKSLEWQHLPEGPLPPGEAIVILGGGLKFQEHPRRMVEVAEAGDRVLYGAKLYHQNRAPLIVATGGRIHWQGEEPPESADMVELLTILGVPKAAILEESASVNTYQNALYTKDLLEPQGIKRILLVTSALHMPRAVAIFAKLGFEVIPAPTDFVVTDGSLTGGQQTLAGLILDLWPDTGRLASTTDALKEYIGIVVYRLRGWL
ncbi:YdcF family protein [Spirulina sp. CCNP1310]|uniref:YdcF family protein n=1 Tax=Spirulina sp. CCNP1310 TaxID=3110249 RepID=UPI002B218873|nr:YdcF family protein [Spirulina sp. CCNP1310]MEA5417947.1 YdcF family protein [Spirulina sp. CCNP1310]